MKNILKKISTIQESIGKISKNADNPFYNSSYADLSNIQDSLQVYLEANKLMVFHQVMNGSLITTILDLESEESLSSEISLSMSDPQKKGSEITYFRRYNLVCLFDLKVQDDDANATTKNPKTQAPKQNDIKIDVWLNDENFNKALAMEKADILKVLIKYDGKTKQSDGKVYGMKKDYRTQLEVKAK